MKYKLKKAKRAKQRYLGIYLALRNRGVSANWLLVPNCIEKHTRRFDRADLPHLMERGNIALISSVDCFDPWRGYCFSTYACNAILKSFLHKPYALPAKPIDEKISDQLGTATDDSTELWIERLKRILNTPCLSPRERECLAYRFGCFEYEQKLTLQEVAAIWGVTKERVRQIQLEALSKLKEGLKNDTVLH
jgi:RNA polymerase sigma factor (sigma-70 family)